MIGVSSTDQRNTRMDSGTELSTFVSSTASSAEAEGKINTSEVLCHRYHETYTVQPLPPGPSTTAQS